MCLRGANPAFKQFTLRNTSKMSHSILISFWLWGKFSKKGLTIQDFQLGNVEIFIQTSTLAAVELKKF